MQPDGPQALTYQDLRFTFEVSPSSLLLVAHQGAPAHILLAPESDYTRSAESLGVSDEAKIGSSEFDQKYVIRDVAGQAKQMLTPAVIRLVEALEPFIELELCDDMVRLLKRPQDQSSALKDIETLGELCRTLNA